MQHFKKGKKGSRLKHFDCTVDETVLLKEVVFDVYALDAMRKLTHDIFIMVSYIEID